MSSKYKRVLLVGKHPSHPSNCFLRLPGGRPNSIKQAFNILLLEVAEQTGCVLDLIEDGAIRVLGQNSRILQSEGPGLQRLKADAWLVGKGRPAECRLSGLLWAQSESGPGIRRPSVGGRGGGRVESSPKC